MTANTAKIISLGELAARIPDGTALGLGGKQPSTVILVLRLCPVLIA